MDDRQLTVIVVPHGDLETRSFVISYRKLQVLLLSALAVGLFLAIVVASWFPVASTAARVPALKRELQQLESERAQVDELSKALRDVEAQYKKVRELLGADAPVAGTPPTLPALHSDSQSKEPHPLSQANPIHTWPLAARGFLTQTVGTGRATHPGIDIAIAVNTDVRAAGSGVVINSGVDDVYGTYLVVDHGDDYQTVYGHLNKVMVKQGDLVTMGQRIALTGSTGRSTGSHLHFEVRHNREFLDPLRFVKQPD